MELFCLYKNEFFQASDFSYLSLSRGQISRRNARQSAQECESLHGTIKLTGVATYAIENCGSCNCTLIIKKIEDGAFHEPYDESDLTQDNNQLTEKVCNHIYVQSGEIKRNPDMEKSAVWAGRVCKAVSPISGLRFISPHCTILPLAR